MRSVATQRASHRAGDQTEQRVDTAFRLLGREACILPHHPPTTWTPAGYIRTGTGHVDRSGWIRRRVRGSVGTTPVLHTVPVAFDVKHVSAAQSRYKHDAKAAHQLATLLEFAEAGLAGILIVHDTAHAPGGRWCWLPVRTQAHVDRALAGVRLLPRQRGPGADVPEDLVSMPLGWCELPPVDAFRTFLQRW